MGLKEESEKADLKLNIQKIKIMAVGPITSWQIDGEKMETVTGFIFLSSKITADGDCSHEIKRHSFLERKAMTNLDSVLHNECRICFSPSFLPSSLPPPFPPPSFHFIFSSFYFSPHPLPPFLFFFNSFGLTFISATCSLRLGNTRILHLSGYFSDQISSSNAS